MTIGLKFRYSLIASLLLSVSACSSSDSGNSSPASNGDAANSDPQGPLVTSADPMLNDPATEGETPPDNTTDSPIDDAPVAEDESTEGEDSTAGVDSSADEEPAAEEEPATEEDPFGPPDAPGGDNSGDNSSEDPADDADADADADSDSDPIMDDDADTATLLIPPVVPGSDLERLVQGLTEQVSITLLKLNELIFSGGELTDQQDACLGSFEEGLGVALTAIDCGELPLTTGNILIRVGEAAFYDTPECLRSLMNNSSEGCILQRLSLMVGADWDDNETGPPDLLFPGALVDYAIDDTAMHIDNDGEMLAGFFSCDIDLETLALTTEFDGAGCDNTVKIVADEIEKRQNP